MTSTATPVTLQFAAPRRPKPPRHLADLTVLERRAAVVSLGGPAFRADQLSRHYFARLTDPTDVDAMTDLPARGRAALVEELLPTLLTEVSARSCDAGLTRKTLWRAFDGARLESVLMRYPDRSTVCVSSQAGCGMGCPFCATGQAGLTRNLSTAEIVEQVVAAARTVRSGLLGGDQDTRGAGGPDGESADHGRLSNVVFMGMGEPLANYRAVTGALRRLTEPSPAGLGLSARSVTVSTVGLVPAIRRLAAEGLPVTLALSLHAPDDDLRDRLVPVNTRWPVAEVLEAAWDYAAVTGRRVSIEYAMIAGVNDRPEQADRLGRLLAGQLTHVNLIPLNPTPGSEWTASAPADEREFVRRLRAHGVTTTVRDTRGREIAGACGQLAADTETADTETPDTAHAGTADAEVGAPSAPPGFDPVAGGRGGTVERARD
ncbi:MAG: 23S rRNA (adenine(2503)-C(2))-methyltransferase RlmN [Frankia sp.]